MSPSVRVERHGDIPVLLLHRPERANAFDGEMIAAFVQTLDLLAERPPRALVLGSAGGRSFSAGYDISGIDPDGPPPLPDIHFEEVIHAARRFPAPIVAAVSGHAFGGGLDLALAADLRVARSGVRVAMTPCRLGLVYSPEGLARFVARLGAQTTRRLFLTAAPLDAAEALRLGILDELTAGDPLPRALELARLMAANAPLAVSGTRRIIQELEDRLAPREGDLVALAEELRQVAWGSRDLRRGLEAFALREAPVFQSD